MAKSYKEITRELSQNLATFRKAQPDVMAGFSSMASAATKTATLDSKTKELIALGIGVAGRCDGCIGFHCQKLVALGASREEVAETLGLSVYMGGGPSLMYAADALKAFDEFSET